MNQAVGEAYANTWVINQSLKSDPKNTKIIMETASGQVSQIAK